MNEVRMIKSAEDCKGGDVRFQTGMGGDTLSDGRHVDPLHGSFIFVAGDREMMRIDPDGAFYVRGERVGTQVEVYEQFRAWLKTAVVVQEPA